MSAETKIRVLFDAETIAGRNAVLAKQIAATGAGGLITIVDQEGVRLTKGAGRLCRER